MIRDVIRKCRFLIIIAFVVLLYLWVIDPLFNFALVSIWKTKEFNAKVAPHWHRFTNAECGYVVEFPSKPFENPITLSNRQNVISYRQFASAVGSNQAFMVATLVTSLTNTYSHEQIKFLLDNAAHGTLAAGDELVAERDIRIGANLGREIEIIKNNGNFVKIRFYQVEHDLQQLTVLDPRAYKQSTNISHFLDSFHLISQ